MGLTWLETLTRDRHMKKYPHHYHFFILFKRESSVFDEHFKVKHQIAVYGVNGISVKTTQNIFYIIVSHHSATRSNRVSNQLAWTDKD